MTQLPKSSWDSSYKSGFTPWRDTNPQVESIIEKARITSGGVLDLGCGSGEWSAAFARKGFEVEGLDYSDEAIKIAQSQTTTAEFTNWDLEDLERYPFKKEGYELILDLKVLAFIKDKNKYLQTIANKLMGIFFLQVFHKHDEKPSICVTKEEFAETVLKFFNVKSEEILEPRTGKVIGTYYLIKK